MSSLLSTTILTIILAASLFLQPNASAIGAPFDTKSLLPRIDPINQHHSVPAPSQLATTIPTPSLDQRLTEPPVQFTLSPTPPESTALTLPPINTPENPANPGPTPHLQKRSHANKKRQTIDSPPPDANGTSHPPRPVWQYIVAAIAGVVVVAGVIFIIFATKGSGGCGGGYGCDGCVCCC